MADITLNSFSFSFSESPDGPDNPPGIILQVNATFGFGLDIGLRKFQQNIFMPMEKWAEILEASVKDPVVKDLNERLEAFRSFRRTPTASKERQMANEVLQALGE